VPVSGLEVEALDSPDDFPDDSDSDSEDDALTRGVRVFPHHSYSLGHSRMITQMAGPSSQEGPSPLSERPSSEAPAEASGSIRRALGTLYMQVSPFSSLFVVVTSLKSLCAFQGQPKAAGRGIRWRISKS